MHTCICLISYFRGHTINIQGDASFYPVDLHLPIPLVYSELPPYLSIPFSSLPFLFFLSVMVLPVIRFYCDVPDEFLFAPTVNLMEVAKAVKIGRNASMQCKD